MRQSPLRLGRQGEQSTEFGIDVETKEGGWVAKTALALRFDAAPGHLLRRAQQVQTEVWCSTVGTEVTGPQYATLVAVASWPKVDQKRAAQLASLDKSTIAGVVARLEEKGWITRTADPQDARRRLLVLTDHAKAGMPALSVAAQCVTAKLLDPLPSVRHDAFVELLQAVAYGPRGKAPSQAPNRGGDILELKNTPGYLIRRAQQVHLSIWNDVFGRELTAPQYAVLAATAGRDPVDQARIGARASLDSSSVADIVTRLAAKGWLTRRRDPSDRRRMLIELTSPAVIAMRHLTRSADEVQKLLLKGLNEVQASDFIDMMQRVARIHEDALLTAAS